jgi:phage gp29-like protein
MSFFGRLKDLVSPPKVTTTRVNLREKPLHEQFQRIGGGLSPADVSRILQRADMGQPATLIDLFNEGRQKDGHLQGICYTRDIAVSLCGLEFVDPTPAKGKEKPARKDQKAIDLCRRARDKFDDFPRLVEHLTGAYVPGHATATVRWEKTKDGLLLPAEAELLSPRDFIFAQKTGKLRYQRDPFDLEGIDILAENPGRVVQVQRRITGDVQVREGLIRCLVWAALFRNWSLKDWIALGEIGWKPWRLASYKKGASQKDIDELIAMLERLGATGVAAIPETTDIKVEWPKGMAPGTGGSSTHRELLDTMGREMSKAVLGQTTSAEPGPNGSRASDEVRDKVRADIREEDAIATAAALYKHLFRLVVSVNLGPDVECPVPWFQTDESVDQLAFAQAVKNLADAKVRIPQKWIRDELGAPEPKEGEECIGEAEPEPEPDGEDPEKDPEADDAEKAAA